MSAALQARTMQRGNSKKSQGSGYIIGPLADAFFVIGAPLVGLVLVLVLFSLPISYFDVTIQSSRFDLRRILIYSFVNAHTFVMFFRSHGNPKIFRVYPLRFTIVPLTMIVLGSLSTSALLWMGLIIVWWDIYHAAMQTFGFGRIYDSKMGNDANVGRSLDWWMNFLIVAGPVLSGMNFITHVNNTRDILQFLTPDGTTAGRLFLHQTLDFIERNHARLATAILALGIPFSCYYIYSYYKLAHRGYRISWQKVWLLTIASLVSIYIWGFHSFHEGFFVQNFFHCLQYFAIVIFAEYKNTAQLFRLDRLAFGGILAAGWMIAFSFVFGLWASSFASGDAAMSVLVTGAIMHYWYDGFIWSVQQKQV